MKKFGLIGKKLSHSFSKRYFTDKFERLRMEAVYELFELEEVSEFPKLLAREKELAGLNVTIPYKSAILPFLDELAEEARQVGAVNTIVIDRGGKTIGHNTDVHGFRLALENLMAEQQRDKALVLGTGGAAKAVCYALRQHFGIQDIKLVSRSSSPLPYPVLTYPQAKEIALHNYLVINTTPLGMYPDTGSFPDLNYGRIDSSNLVMDLVYNPETTLFMSKCAAQGAKVQNGLQMLYAQAEEAFRIWSGA